MKIGVISDTHLNKPDEMLSQLCETVFADAEMIFHAGDLTGLAVLNAFSGKDVVAVSGNMDRHDVAFALHDREVVQVGRFSIGLIHGWGSSRGIEERILKEFNAVDAIVYGHTHQPSNHLVNGVLMFNPGAYSGSVLFGTRRSVGLLTINDSIIGSIIPL